MKNSNKSNRQAITSAIKHSQPLIKLPESKIQIYSDCIKAQIVNLFQVTTVDTGEFASISDIPRSEQMSKQKSKENVLNYQKNDSQRIKVFMFNNPDFAFNIDQKMGNVQIHNLVSHSVVLKFKVHSIQNLLTIQSLLRRKMCQLGFQNKYKMIKLLGKGATAEVQLVERISDKKLFAAKIISIKQANDKTYQTFINQAKLLRMLKHKNIANLQSLYIYKKQLIQVMEYLSGGTILQMIKDDKLNSRKQKWSVLRDLTHALDYLRQRRIVHRDLKLENVLVRQNGDIKQYVLSDFGLATWTGQKNPIFQRCGTPGYIAPQVLNAPKGKPILSHKADIFSLGVIAHILFLHQPLFYYSGNVKQLLKLNKKAEYSLQNKLYKQLTLSQSTFLQLTLCKNPQQRASASIILQQLKYPMSSFSEVTTQKSARQRLHTKISVNPKNFGIQIEVKKETSLTKTKINFSSDKKFQTKESSDRKQVRSAKKFIADMWNSIMTPTPKKQRLKIKQNSIQKHKKLTQYFQ